MFLKIQRELSVARVKILSRARSVHANDLNLAITAHADYMIHNNGRSSVDAIPTKKWATDMLTFIWVFCDFHHINGPSALRGPNQRHLHG